MVLGPDQLLQTDDRALVVVEAQQPLIVGLELADQERVGRYMERASSPATLRAYRSDWAIFVAWCDARSLSSLPAAPAIVAAFLTNLADRGLKRSTIGRRLAAIVFAHRAAGHAPPADQVGSVVLERAMTGVRRDKRDEPVDKKRAADGDVLRDMLRAIDGDSIRSIRDRALLAIGMGGALP